VLYLAEIIKEKRSALPQPTAPEFPVGREIRHTGEAINGETYAPGQFFPQTFKKRYVGKTKAYLFYRK
jgi:hypothetical protein